MRKSALVAVLIALVMTVSFLGAHAEEVEKKSKAKISEGSKVKFHYTLAVEGEVIDSSRDRDPMELEVGGGQLIPGFEKAIMGMKVGEKKSFEVSPEEGYGPEDPDAIQKISRVNMPPDLDLEVDMVLYAQSPEGDSFPARVVEVGEDYVVMNFNHPLAGKTLNFEVEIVSID